MSGIYAASPTSAPGEFCRAARRAWSESPETEYRRWAGFDQPKRAPACLRGGRGSGCRRRAWRWTRSTACAHTRRTATNPRSCRPRSGCRRCGSRRWSGWTRHRIVRGTAARRLGRAGRDGESTSSRWRALCQGQGPRFGRFIPGLGGLEFPRPVRDVLAADHGGSAGPSETARIRDRGRSTSAKWR